MITTAVGQGRRAAFMIDRWLQGAELDAAAFDEPLAGGRQATVLARQDVYDRREPLESQRRDERGADRLRRDRAAVDRGRGVPRRRPLPRLRRVLRVPRLRRRLPGRCDPPRHARGGPRGRGRRRRLATGFKLFPADVKPQYGYGRYKNVITGMQMDRLLAPTRPYNTVLRPGDGKVPDRIAYVMCTGSRDETVDNPLCSKICCMYSIKQNQLIMGALPLADVTVYYIDVRTVGKGYDEFYQQARDMGANFIKGRVAGDHRDRRRQPHPALRGHRERRRARRGRVRPRRAGGRRAAEPRGRSASSRTAPWASTTTSTSARPTRTWTPAGPACPASSSPARPPGPRTSPTPSSMPGPRSPRPPRTWSARK